MSTIAPRLGILWRGPLDSCNYACSYCPFAKRAIRPRNLAADREALLRFVTWIEQHDDRAYEILFTPWGEALIHRWYQDALVRLSHCDHVVSVAIQSNGSSAMRWVERARRERVSLWLSWHPTETDASRFVRRVERLTARGVPLSVGGVALPAHLDALQAMRRALPAEVPMWLNAQRPYVRYTDEEVARCLAIDPLFGHERRPHRTRGAVCKTGEEVIAIDGAGEITRCHFVDERLGNLYEDSLSTVLAPRRCEKAQCDCFIGYAHLAQLDLRSELGDGLLARRRLPIAV